MCTVWKLGVLCCLGASAGLLCVLLLPLPVPWLLSLLCCCCAAAEMREKFMRHNVKGNGRWS